MHDADEKRYDNMRYRRAGASGLLLPELSLGLWQNFGDGADDAETRKMVTKAFDSGITYFDLANNYGPPPGSAERRFGRILKEELSAYRDELIISTKAGYDMWKGPYGNWGSKKYLTASLDQSLRRLGLDYVDIFYHHRPDPQTPMEETAEALFQAVRSGKALYVAISNYPLKDAMRMHEILEGYGVHPTVNQVRYNIYDREIEKDNLLLGMENIGMGSVIFSPLHQGLLTDKYLGGNVPSDSRAVRSERLQGILKNEPRLFEKLQTLDDLASQRGQSLSDMAIAWLLGKGNVTTVLVGARTLGQLEGNLRALDGPRDFSPEELEVIESTFPSVFTR